MPSENEFNKQRREALFMELAGRRDGVTVRTVHEEAHSQGDRATEEAYYNLARRLEHRGLVVAQEGSRPKKYTLGQAVDAQWLEEEDLAELVSDEYPLLTLPIWREAARQISDVPEELWVELRERLATENAQALFTAAIESYCSDLDAAFKLLKIEISLDQDQKQVSRQKEEVRTSLQMLQMLIRYGLGISSKAITLPTQPRSWFRICKTR